LKKQINYANVKAVEAKGKVSEYRAKAVFILYYLKVYPTFDVLRASFKMARSKACENAYKVSCGSVVLLYKT
jgi:hypothetical protein